MESEELGSMFYEDGSHHPIIESYKFSDEITIKIEQIERENA